MEEKTKKGNQLLFWIGIIACVLCVCGFFISSNWISRTYNESIISYKGDDSDAARFLLEIELFFLKVAIWLKELPVAAKVIGIVVGGWIAIENYDDNDN